MCFLTVYVYANCHFCLQAFQRMVRIIVFNFSLQTKLSSVPIVQSFFKNLFKSECSSLLFYVSKLTLFQLLIILKNIIFYVKKQQRRCVYSTWILKVFSNVSYLLIDCHQVCVIMLYFCLCLQKQWDTKMNDCDWICKSIMGSMTD